MATPVIRPFPWGALLARARRVDARLLGSARAALTDPSPVTASMRSLAELAKCSIEAHLLSVGVDDATPMVARTVTLQLLFESTAVPWSMTLEVEAALVAGLVARVCRRPTPRVVNLGPSGNASPAMVGAFAALVATAIRKAVGPVVVVDASMGVVAVAQGALVAGLEVRVDDETFHVRAAVPRTALAPFEGAFTKAHIAAWPGLPVELPIVACRSVAAAAEIAVLSAGDTWMVGAAWDRLLPRNVWLCAEQGTLGFAATLEPDGRLVLGHYIEELGWFPMPDANDRPELIAAVGEVPVVIRVEIGAARMKAREWAALVPGDVVGMGSKVGSKVTLRVSGQAVAEGDLVEIDGELGVRIRRRLGEK